MANQNLELLKVAAKLLEPVLDELVFVGGCATGLLVSDEAAAEVRPTFDVDAIAEITSYVEYTIFGERLHKLGFTEDASEGAHLPLATWPDQVGSHAFGRKRSILYRRRDRTNAEVQAIHRCPSRLFTARLGQPSSNWPAPY